MEKTVKYRDRSLRKVRIDVKAYFTGGDSQGCCDLVFHEGTNDFAVVLKYIDFPFRDSPELRESAMLEASVNLAKCMTLDTSYGMHPFSEGEYDPIILSARSEDRNEVTFGFERNSKAVTVLHPLMRRLHIEENRLARQIILDILYEKGHESDIAIDRSAHFPSSPISRELQALQKSEYVVSYSGGNSLLTHAGRLLYEANPGGDDSIVFIIAACHVDDYENSPDDEVAHQAILDTYKGIFDGEPFFPVFQESEEPKKSIHVDIFDYIDSCAFVIADITYNRPNCYVEIGYALARGKHIIGFMQKEYFDNRVTKPGQSRIPFDLTGIKFQEYSIGDTQTVRTCLETRLGVVKNRRLA